MAGQSLKNKVAIVTGASRGIWGGDWVKIFKKRGGGGFFFFGVGGGEVCSL